MRTKRSPKSNVRESVPALYCWETVIAFRARTARNVFSARGERFKRGKLSEERLAKQLKLCYKMQHEFSVCSVREKCDRKLEVSYFAEATATRYFYFPSNCNCN